MKVLVTGSTGLVGSALCAGLVARGFHVVGTARSRPSVRIPGVDYRVVGELGSTTNWQDAVAGAKVVVHCAARVHIIHETLSDPLAAFRVVNVLGTEHLALQASAAGVQRLVYVSSIKVNGEETRDRPFTEQDRPQPSDAYAISKWEAERALHGIASRTGLEIVVVRPPLVYGPGVKGNFLSLMRLVHRGVPLPLGRCHNRRSLLGLGNFVDFLATCIDHPASSGETFVLSDGKDFSTPELIRHLAVAMGRPARLLPIPPALVQLATSVLGKPGIYQRLCGSLQVDPSHARRLLGWIPPQTTDAGLTATAQAFLKQP